MQYHMYGILGLGVHVLNRIPLDKEVLYHRCRRLCIVRALPLVLDIGIQT